MKTEDKIKAHAVSLLRLYYRFKTVKGAGDFRFAEYRQAYRDALYSLKKEGLIEAFNLHEPEITWIDGHTQKVEVPNPRK